MRTENGTITNVLRLDSDLHLNGMWVGSCHVTNRAHLELHGTVTGDLIVDAKASATINGTVAGDLRADGAVTVAGVVTGLANGPGLAVLPNAQIGC